MSWLSGQRSPWDLLRGVRQAEQIQLGEGRRVEPGLRRRYRAEPSGRNAGNHKTIPKQVADGRCNCEAVPH